jgi:hypothetical protein
MTPEHRLTLIIETIRAIKIGTPVFKGLVTLLLEPWPDLYWTAITGLPWSDRGRVGSIRFRQPSLGLSAPVSDQRHRSNGFLDLKDGVSRRA